MTTPIRLAFVEGFTYRAALCSCNIGNDPEIAARRRYPETMTIPIPSAAWQCPGCLTYYGPSIQTCTCATGAVAITMPRATTTPVRNPPTVAYPAFGPVMVTYRCAGCDEDVPLYGHVCPGARRESVAGLRFAPSAPSDKPYTCVCGALVTPGSLHFCPGAPKPSTTGGAS